MPRVPKYNCGFNGDIVYVTDPSSDLKIKALEQKLDKKIEEASRTSEEIRVKFPAGSFTDTTVIEAGTKIVDVVTDMLAGSGTPGPGPITMQAWFYDGPAPLDEEGN